MKRWGQFIFLLLVAVTALGSNGLASRFAPEAAYNAYGGSIERLEQRLPLFYGGEDQSLTYQVTYGTLSAATVFIGGEFGQAGRLGRAGAWTAETKLAAEVAQKTAESAAKRAPITDPSRLLTAGTDIPNAGGVIRTFVQQRDQIYYRVFSGDRVVGSYLTAVPPRSSAWAQEALSLPPGNTAQYVQEVLIPAGTWLQRSRALPVPEWGRFRGGAEQFWILPGQELPAQNFGPGVPLP